MKSFKKIMAGVCSLVMLSGIATYAVSAELGDSIGSSDTDIGISDIVKPGDSENPVKPGDSDKPNPGDSGNIGDSGEKGVTGDVNGVGNVKSNDLLLLKKYLMGFVEAKEINMANADVTGDGEVKANDLLLLKKYLLGLREF